MITIISGDIRSGKTTNLIKAYSSNNNGDGFVSEKLYENNEFIGYTIRRLSEDHKRPWMIHDKFYKKETDFDGMFGPYHFNSKTMEQIEIEVSEMIKNKVSPIYIDEIGRLEIVGGGFCNILKLLLENNVDVYLAIRSEFVFSVCRHFKINEFKVIDIERFSK